MPQRPRPRTAAAMLGLALIALALAPTPARGDERGASAQDAPAQGYMGVQLEPAAQGAVRVVSVPAGTPAERAGVQSGDVIVDARGGPPGSVDTFTRSVRTAGAGTAYRIVVLRGRARVPITVQLEAAPSARGSVALGSPAPPLSAQVVMGSGPADLAQLRGRVVVVDFWASWCGPCRMLMPALNRMHRRFAAQGLTVLGVTDESAQIARAVGAQMSIGYTIASDAQAASRFGVQGLPTTVVIDRRGNVRRVGVGVDANEVRQLDRLVQQLLAEPAP